MPRRHAKIWYHRHGIRVPDRPWFGLTESQRENRFDTVAWHEREIFLEEILKHPSLLVRKRAERSTEEEMQILVRAFKQGVDLASVTLERLQKAVNWHKLPRAPSTYVYEPDPPKAGVSPETPAKGKASAPLAAPPVVGTYADLSKTLDNIVARAAGVRPQPVRQDTPRRNSPDQQERPVAGAFAGMSRDQGARSSPEGSDCPPSLQGRQGARQEAPGAAEHAIPEDLEEEAPSEEVADRPKSGGAPKPDLDDIAAIREKLTRNGKVRLDVEALSVYILCPSFFSIASGMVPEWWQTEILDSYAPRLGCLASRQCGKSLAIAMKTTAFGMCNPGSTTLVLAPTLRQSTELLSKILAVVMNAGLKVAASNQFQLVLGGDKVTPGEGSRLVALPGSNEDSGASARGYAADMLVLEEAAFLKDDVISSVLPSIAARPKAQLIGISSAGIIGTYFHSVMTSPQSRWQKMIVPASRSGRFTPEQLEEMKHNLGADRYAVEFECRWGTVGASLFTSDVFDAAFGTDSGSPPEPSELDADAAFGHLDLERIFGARMDKRVA